MIWQVLKNVIALPHAPEIPLQGHMLHSTHPQPQLSNTANNSNVHELGKRQTNECSAFAFNKYHVFTKNEVLFRAL